MPQHAVNIGPVERWKRTLYGVAMLVVSSALISVLIATGASREWRAVVLLPLWLSMLGFFQAREKT